MTKCVKCGGEEMRTRRGNGGAWGMNKLPLGKGKTATVAMDNLVCTSCGHVEFFITSEAALAKITETWDRP